MMAKTNFWMNMFGFFLFVILATNAIMGSYTVLSIMTCVFMLYQWIVNQVVKTELNKLWVSVHAPDLADKGDLMDRTPNAKNTKDTADFATLREETIRKAAGHRNVYDEMERRK